MSPQATQSAPRSWEELKDQVRSGRVVRTHSAQVRPGDVFLALPGTRAHGELFIAEAVARGATTVVVGPDREGRETHGAAVLEHPDPRKALGELAAEHFGTGRQCPQLVGVTGTNGKTTVTCLVEHLLRSAGHCVGVIGTIGARWPGGEAKPGMTTPDCWTLHELLARMRDQNVDLVCMEVSSHALDQQRTAGLRFEAAVLTNVTQDHLDYHGDMEQYFQAKAKLFAPGPDGPRHRVLNADDPFGLRLLQGCKGLGYGMDQDRLPERDFLHGKAAWCTRRGLGLDMCTTEASWRLESPLVGRHNAANLLAAQGTGLCLGLEPRDMQALREFQGVSGRLERIANARDLDIFVDYAHTPDALENVLQALKALDFSRIIVVFGCGGDRDRTKRLPMSQAVARWADVAVLTSDNPRHEDPEAIMDDAWPGLRDCGLALREADRRTAIDRALELMRPGDALLVAGKGHEITQQIGAEKLPFHDPTVIRELLECA